jgi:Zn-dependent protease
MDALFNMSFRVGRLFDIDIRVHILMILYVGFYLFSAGPGDWVHTLVFIGVLFGIVLCHEFGHCFGARSVGGDADLILMWPLGGLAFAHAPMTPWAQFVTVACGPLVNVAFCVISGAILIGVMGSFSAIALSPFSSTPMALYKVAMSTGVAPPEWAYYMAIFYDINLMLLAFNLLPIYPMDGGQLLFTLLWPFLGLRTATIVACQLGLVGAVGLGLWGLSGQGGSMMMALAIMGGMTCWQRLQMARFGVMMDERIGTYGATGRYHRTRGFWSRLFRSKSRRAGDDAEDVDARNPNPDGWQARLDEERKLEEDVDRILKKVRERGLGSLSYIEKQVLERATRARREREEEIGKRS